MILLMFLVSCLSSPQKEYEKANKLREKTQKYKLKKYAEQLSERTMSRGFKIQHLITSAKTGLNVNLAFEIIGKTILDFQKTKDKK